MHAYLLSPILDLLMLNWSSLGIPLSTGMPVPNYATLGAFTPFALAAQDISVTVHMQCVRPLHAVNDKD